MMTWPKPVQKPHPPILIGGAFPYSARRAIRYGDGWMPQLTEKMQTPFAEQIPAFRRMAEEAGRDPATLSISVWGRQPNMEEIEGYEALGVERVCTSLESAKEDEILPVLDRWVPLIERLKTREIRSAAVAPTTSLAGVRLDASDRLKKVVLGNDAWATDAVAHHHGRVIAGNHGGQHVRSYPPVQNEMGPATSETGLSRKLGSSIRAGSSFESDNDPTNSPSPLVTGT